MSGKKLVVKMFGDFSASYGGEGFAFGGQRYSKFAQLFQILMTRPGQGFDKGSIAEALYKWEEVENPNASLNNTIFRLRKYLEASPLPSSEYICLEAGVLRFAGGLDAESDVWEFEKLENAFEEERNARKKADLCEKACELYRGEFLPQLSSEQWVNERSRDYRKQYITMMKYLLGFLKGTGDYREIERLAARAADIYPYEGWENWQMDALIALEMYSEAEALYKETVAYIQKQGRFLSREQQAEFERIAGRLQQPKGDEEEIRNYLAETMPGQGAYACTLPNFSGCFHMLKRVIRRGSVQFVLLLCTILNERGQPVDNTDACEKLGKKLCESFQAYLRLGDIYTKYSENQYLLLCVGAEKENITEIGGRIDQDFRKRCGGRVGMSYRLLDDGAMWG